MGYVYAVFAVGFVILAHEFGHLVAAKLTGISVRVFSVGFGPRLFGMTRGGTEYRFSLVPLGGYVMPDIEDENAFFDLPILSRVMLAAGGPAASLVLPLFCFAFAGVLRSGFGIDTVVINPFARTAEIFWRTASIMPLLFSHHGELSGIAGVVSQGGRYIGSSIENLLSFAGFVSINLAVLNLLPIPVLDGGKIVLYSLEKLNRKFVKLHYPLAVAGWVFMAAVMIYATILDVGRII